MHVAPHGTKGTRFAAVSSMLNSLEEFVKVGGVSQSKIEDVYKRLMSAHRTKVTHGEYTSGDREGPPNAMSYLCNAMMKEEDEYQAEKTAKTDAEKEALAKKEAKGQEVRLRNCRLPEAVSAVSIFVDPRLRMLGPTLGKRMQE